MDRSHEVGCPSLRRSGVPCSCASPPSASFGGGHITLKDNGGGVSLTRAAAEAPPPRIRLRLGCIPVPFLAPLCTVALSKYQPLKTSPQTPVLSYGACRPTRTWTA